MEDILDDHQILEVMAVVDDEVSGGGGTSSVPEQLAGTMTQEQEPEDIKQLKVLVRELEEGNREIDILSKMYKEERRNGLKENQVKLERLLKEEEEYQEMVYSLTKTLVLRSRVIRTKLEEVRELKMKLDELRLGKVKEKSVAKKQVGGIQWRRDAVAILPEEMWKMIFGNIPDPKDLWNLCNTCQLFDSILSPWKTGWMLEQAMPYLYQHLPGNKLLESRLVCKSWKGTVDHFLEDHPSLRPHDPEDYEARKLAFVNPMKEKEIGESYEFTFSDTMDLAIFDDPAFIEKWKQGSIIGRCITLKLEEHDRDGAEEEANNYPDFDENGEGGLPLVWERFYSFLHSFGKGVWYLNASYSLSDEIGDFGHQILAFLTTDLFQIFPNLRKLCVGFHGEWEFEGVIDHQLSLISAPKLETFASACWDRPIASALVPRYHAQLRRLHLTVGSWKILNLNPLTLPNLTELHLTHFYDKEDFKGLWNGMRMPQLSKFGMSVGLEEFTDNAEDLHILMGAITKLSRIAPLTTLRLEGLPEGWDVGELDGGGYALSQVKTLELHHYAEGTSSPKYDFLLRYFPLLENLNLYVRKDLQEFISEWSLPETELGLLDQAGWEELTEEWDLVREHGILDVNKFMYDRDMYRSNIWELMPLLKIFSFQWDIYTRHEYDASQKKLKDHRPDAEEES